MTLISLPDCKTHHPLLKLGKEYEILRRIGNGVVIQPDSGDDTLLLLESRFTTEAQQ
jgi:hypothetical protein